MSAVPSGFARRASGSAKLYAREDRIEALVAAGFGDPEAWVSRLDAPSDGVAGRGATAVVTVAARSGGPQAERLRLKQMRRGGLVGPLWRERFPGTERLLANLRVPLVAADRGVATAEPVALLTLQGPPGLFRAWMAFVEIEGAVDLLARFRAADPPGEGELRVAMATVRHMHDAGIEHVDLNLGNLLVRTTDDGFEAFVIDLDRGRVRSGEVPEARRGTALRRLERSFRKNFPAAAPPLWCYRLYAEDDPQRVARFLASRPASWRRS